MSYWIQGRVKKFQTLWYWFFKGRFWKHLKLSLSTQKMFCFLQVCSLSPCFDNSHAGKCLHYRILLVPTWMLCDVIWPWRSKWHAIWHMTIRRDTRYDLWQCDAMHNNVIRRTTVEHRNVKLLHCCLSHLYHDISW